MSDKMIPIPVEKLLNHILEEYKSEHTIFGIRDFYKAPKGKTLPIFGETIETPFGPAAGPNTQLAQNIIASYLCGSRFFELKTVQKLDGDDLPVAKPCILSSDEGYNCEWSTELYVPQAFDEYVKAWVILKILSKELDLGSPDGFVFNMSVGYDLAGIKLPKIDTYLEDMRDASKTDAFKQSIQAALAAMKNGKFKKITEKDIHAIPAQVSRSVTISTLHGCPPAEIESMAMYLLKEKGFNTFVKCNPTLLGYDYARKTLDGLGFDYIAFDDHHFKEDLQYSDAVPMLSRLQKTAAGLHLEFGVKITNTFPVDVKEKQLPSEEMYMSGRALLPLSLSVANKLTNDFNGKLRISYSGGADVANIGEIFSSGVWPITMATNILKPGGYGRMVQIGEVIQTLPFKKFEGVNVKALNGLTEKACAPATGSTKSVKPAPLYKDDSPLPLLDCFTAPCSDTCPIHQDIPLYVKLTGEGKYDEALRVITDKNPLPFITGTICAHTCMGRCTRNFYESGICIRSEKLKAAEKGYKTVLSELKAGKTAAQKNGRASCSAKNVAIVGAGPAGLSAAYFLAREGVPVTIFEKYDTCGGIVRHVIPSFRIADSAIEKDVELVKACGAKVVTGTEIKDVKSLFAKGFSDVLLAIGAWKHASMKMDGAEPFDALSFLEDCKSGDSARVAKYGKNIAVIGGGNTAMDTARAAKRIAGVKNVYLVYRRTKRYMPADEEELQMAIDDGVQFCELRAPKSVSGGKLICSVMKLGEPDAGGRRTPVDTGKTESFACDSIIAATGEHIDDDFLKQNGISVDEKGRPVISAAMETSVPHLYIAGDAAQGPATVVKAIAGATSFARAITEIHNKNYEEEIVFSPISEVLKKHGVFALKKEEESSRCLECKTVCENCVDVCPNRANVAVTVSEGTERSIQIIHIDAMCNECGNCVHFCPHEGRPYKDKFTLFSKPSDMDNSTNAGFAPLDEKSGISGSRFRVRAEGKTVDIDLASSAGIDSRLIAVIKAVKEKAPYLYY